MRGLTLCLLAAALPGAEVRYARLGGWNGAVEVQARAADAWKPAVRNLPLTQGFRLRTGPASSVEIELDDGSVFRMAADSLCEISDYLQLSNGPRITLLSLDHGIAYLTGQPGPPDALSVVVPGAQATLRTGSRLRFEAGESSSQIAAIEGAARFYSPAAELEVSEGQMIRVDPSRSDKFYLYREISQLETDRWSEQRDKALAATHSGKYVPHLRSGLLELDSQGSWIETGGYGAVWKPAVAPGWAPFRDGKWQWYDGLGYTWVSREDWGWLPYHYGRWMHLDQAGWVWAPGADRVFRPGEVYWMRFPNMAGWGPLAAGEAWNGSTVPQLYLLSNTTFARFAPGATEIDPAGFAERPKDPLAATVFTLALPSPPLLPRQLDIARPTLRTAGFVAPVFAPALPEPVSVSESVEAQRVPDLPPTPPAQTAIVLPPPEPTVFVPVPVPTPVETYYPVPVYTGIVVVNPPEHQKHRPPEHQQPPAAPVAKQPAAPPTPETRISRQQERIPRSESHAAEGSRGQDTESKKSGSEPVSREQVPTPRSESGGSRRTQ